MVYVCCLLWIIFWEVEDATDDMFGRLLVMVVGTREVLFDGVDIVGRKNFAVN